MPNQHSTLIYTMVLASAADSDMTDSELKVSGDLVKHVPPFATTTKTSRRKRRVRVPRC
jgi:hypothetical protein